MNLTNINELADKITPSVRANFILLTINLICS